MNFPKNFADLSMMSPCHCHLIFISPVRHHHLHYRHFYYASLHLCSEQRWSDSTPDSKLTFSTNLPHFFERISRIFVTISGLNCSSVFLLFCSFHLFLFHSCDRLSWFCLLLNCTKIPVLSFLEFLPFFLLCSLHLQNFYNPEHPNVELRSMV